MMAGVALSLLLVFCCSFEYCECFNKFYLHRIDASVAQGSFYSSADLGVSFDSNGTGLSISDLSGDGVLLIQKTSQSQQWICVLGNTFVQLHVSESQGYRDYYVPQFIYKETCFQPSELNVTVLKLLDVLSSRYHYSNLQRSVGELLESPFINPIRNAVYTLGVDLKLRGDIYPSLLPLYLVVKVIEQMQVTTSLNSTKGNGVGDEEDCFKECPPCPDEECLALCGYGCHCWKWVCGDCCYHLGCHGHDICCRENFIQTKCLFPISFKCESEYSC
jgi:hypothetical protein